MAEKDSRHTVYLHLAGSVCFSLGSSFFIWSSWSTQSWLRPFQYGCGTWIAGCCLFLIPFWPRIMVYSRSKREMFSDLCLGSALISYLVGCTLAFGTEDAALRQLPYLNGLFLAGSLLLLVNSAFEWYLHFAGRSDEQKSSIGSMQLWVDLIVAISFVLAAVLGGYGSSVSTVRAGVICWGVGSVVGGLPPLSELLQTGGKDEPRDRQIEMEPTSSTGGGDVTPPKDPLEKSLRIDS